jgi:uncharacterized membrane protein
MAARVACSNVQKSDAAFWATLGVQKRAALAETLMSAIEQTVLVCFT